MTDKSQWLLMEHEDALFRCEAADWPVEVWRPREQTWVPYPDAGQKPQGWGTIITPEQFETLKAA